MQVASDLQSGLCLREHLFGFCTRVSRVNVNVLWDAMAHELQCQTF